ncbi:Hypothetical predicted protein [Paramuricea clavata]|uniref:Uncharacterized protein n=1 Tax=Paramuricea clavata TaxID=317549 RepID=A0A7D9EBU6_PARCT|nr:Hypothetical predicted protein [Paramuricea clavata]
MERYHDQHARFREFHSGQPVLARNYCRSNGKWQPATVLERQEPHSYLIILADGRLWNRHVYRLLQDSPPPPPLISERPEPIPGNLDSPTDTQVLLTPSILVFLRRSSLLQLQWFLSPKAYGEQKSWKDANSSCASELQFPTGNNKSLINKSYWLGIYKKESCETHWVENLTNVMQLKLKKCPNVGNSTPDKQDYYAKSHAICVQPAICDNDWLGFRSSCYKLEPEETTCHKARNKCANDGSKLVEINYLQEEEFINTSFKGKYLVRVNV